MAGNEQPDGARAKQHKDDVAAHDSGPRPSLREEQKRLTFERLLNAAKELFDEIGIDATTVDQISKRAGTNRTTFYLHFEDKADLAVKVASLYSTDAISGIQRLVRKEQPTRNDIREWLETVAAFCRKNSSEIGLAMDPLNRNAEYLAALLQETDEIAGTGFKAFLDRFDAEEREMVAAELLLLMILVQRYMYFTVIQGLDMPNPKAPEALVSLIYECLSRRPGDRSTA